MLMAEMFMEKIHTTKQNTCNMLFTKRGAWWRKIRNKNETKDSNFRFFITYLVYAKTSLQLICDLLYRNINKF